MTVRKKKVAAKKAQPKDLAASFNLDDFNTLVPSTDGKNIVIKNPVTGKDFETPTGPLTIKVVGPSSDQFKMAMDKMMKSMKKVIPNMNIADIMSCPDTINTTKISITFLVDIIIGWDNVYFHGSTTEQLDFSKEECVDLLRACEWIRPQIELFAQDSLNFIKS